MRWLSMEHGQFAYSIDFIAYGAAIVSLTMLLVEVSPHTRWFPLAALVLFGLTSWSLMEYLLHRFVLHGVEPFRRWHAEHHQRPRALIFTPTYISASMLLIFVFMPALGVLDLWSASSYFLGVLTGYFSYSVIHHALHHGKYSSLWIKRRKHWHALHHRKLNKPGYYGVSSSFWDRVFRSDKFGQD